jgi:hypothetical protein
LQVTGYWVEDGEDWPRCPVFGVTQFVADKQEEALMGVDDVPWPTGNELCNISWEVVCHLDEIRRCHLVGGSEEQGWKRPSHNATQNRWSVPAKDAVGTDDMAP